VLAMLANRDVRQLAGTPDAGRISAPSPAEPVSTA
jgi:hypothetical protein